jgi:hypothetical protein
MTASRRFVALVLAVSGLAAVAAILVPRGGGLAVVGAAAAGLALLGFVVLARALIVVERAQRRR